MTRFKILLISIILMTILTGCSPIQNNEDTQINDSSPITMPTIRNNNRESKTLNYITENLISFTSWPAVAASHGANNIFFNGQYLMVASLSVENKINLSILNKTSLNQVSFYQVPAANIYSIYSTTANEAGNIFVLWADLNNSVYISSYHTSNIAINSATIRFTPSYYGCDLSKHYGNIKIATKYNTIYIACSDSLEDLRFISLSIDGRVLSMNTLQWPNESMGRIGRGVQGLMIKDNNLILATNINTAPWGTGFYAYDSNFQFIRTIEKNNGDQQLKSIANDGDYLYVAKGYEYCSGYTACYRVAKSSLSSF